VDGVVVDDGSFRPVFLVSEGEGRSGGGEEVGRGERKDASVPPKLDIAYAELPSTAAVLRAEVGVLADPQEIVEGDVCEVGDRLGLG
jgi:hypothetical protein